MLSVLLWSDGTGGQAAGGGRHQCHSGGMSARCGRCVLLPSRLLERVDGGLRVSCGAAARRRSTLLRPRNHRSSATDSALPRPHPLGQCPLCISHFHRGAPGNSPRHGHVPRRHDGVCCDAVPLGSCSQALSAMQSAVPVERGGASTRRRQSTVSPASVCRTSAVCACFMPRALTDIDGAGSVVPSARCGRTVRLARCMYRMPVMPSSARYQCCGR
jgi:hypothetical protein